MEGYTDLGTIAPEALGRAAREVRRAYRARLLAQDGQLLLGVACRRLALTYAPPRFRWGSRGPRIQYAEAQPLRLQHRGDELVIRAGPTTFRMRAERQDV